MKKLGHLQYIDAMGGTFGKIAYGTIQIDKKGSELISRFIVSFDLLANVRFSPNLECYIS